MTVNDPGLYLLAALGTLLGTPGVTFWVMRKMTAAFCNQLRERCALCKAALDRRLDSQEEKDKVMEERQITLRTIIIPKLVSREDLRELGADIKKSLESVQSDIKGDIVRLHNRINGFHNNQGGR